MNNRNVNRLLMEHELLNLADSINQLRDSVSGMKGRYGNIISNPIIMKLDSIQSQAKDISKQLISSFDVLNEETVRPKRRYDSFLVDQNLIEYESENRILIRFPDSSDYNGYSIWVNDKYFTKTIDGDGYQVRFYPDALLRIRKYVKQQDGYKVEDIQEISGEALKKNFCQNEVIENTVDDIDCQLTPSAPDIGSGMHL